MTIQITPVAPYGVTAHSLSYLTEKITGSLEHLWCDRLNSFEPESPFGEMA